MQRQFKKKEFDYEREREEREKKEMHVGSTLSH